jgi:hypothetical protein
MLQATWKALRVACVLAIGCGSVAGKANDASVIDAAGDAVTGEDAPPADAPPTDAGFDPDDDLVVHYAFENDVLDSTANANHGTAIGNPSFATAKTGTRGVAIDNPLGQVAATQWVQLPSSLTILALKTRSFTVSICYECTDAAMTNGRLFGNTVGINADYNDGTVAYAYGIVTDQTGAARLVGSENPRVTTDGNWHCQVIVVDREGGEARELIDANLTHDTALGSFGTISTSGLVIGAAKNNDTFGARKMLVDDFRIYDRALSAPEISQLYNALKP